MFRKEISILHFAIVLVQFMLTICTGCIAETVTSYCGTFDVIPTNSAFPPDLVLASGRAYEHDLRFVSRLPFEGIVGLESEFLSTGNGIVTNMNCDSPIKTTSVNFIPVRNSVEIAASLNNIASDLNNPSVSHVSEQVFGSKASGKVDYSLLDITSADTVKYAGIVPCFRYIDIKDPADGSVNARIAASKEPFSLLREGNMLVDGRLPVAGKSAIIGQLPVSGAVKFQGAIPVYGTVTVSGSSSYVYH